MSSDLPVIMPEGSEYWMGDGAEVETFIQIMDLLDPGGDLGSDSTLVNVTPLDATQVKYAASPLRDGGERNIKFNYLPTDPGQIALIAAAEGQETRNFELRLTTGMKWPPTVKMSGAKVLGISGGTAVTLDIKGAVQGHGEIA